MEAEKPELHNVIGSDTLFIIINNNNKAFSH